MVRLGDVQAGKLDDDMGEAEPEPAAGAGLEDDPTKSSRWWRGLRGQKQLRGVLSEDTLTRSPADGDMAKAINALS